MLEDPLRISGCDANICLEVLFLRAWTTAIGVRNCQLGDCGRTPPQVDLECGLCVTGGYVIIAIYISQLRACPVQEGRFISPRTQIPDPIPVPLDLDGHRSILGISDTLHHQSHADDVHIARGRNGCSRSGCTRDPHLAGRYQTPSHGGPILGRVRRNRIAKIEYGRVEYEIEAEIGYRAIIVGDTHWNMDHISPSSGLILRQDDVPAATDDGEGPCLRLGQIGSQVVIEIIDRYRALLPVSALSAITDHFECDNGQSPIVRGLDVGAAPRVPSHPDLTRSDLIGIQHAPIRGQTVKYRHSLIREHGCIIKEIESQSAHCARIVGDVDEDFDIVIIGSCGGSR